MDFPPNQFLPTMTLYAFFVLGVLGTFLPLLPGVFFLWLGIFIHKLWIPENSISWQFFWIITGLALLSQALDWACTYWGAKKFGATWRGALGAVIGLIVGPFVLFFPLGLIIGPILGAIAGELIGGRHWKDASKAGLGAIIGGLVAFVLKLGIAFLMILGFFANLYSM